MTSDLKLATTHWLLCSPYHYPWPSCLLLSLFSKFYCHYFWRWVVSQLSAEKTQLRCCFPRDSNHTNTLLRLLRNIIKPMTELKPQSTATVRRFVRASSVCGAHNRSKCSVFSNRAMAVSWNTAILPSCYGPDAFKKFLYCPLLDFHVETNIKLIYLKKPRGK